MGKLKNNSGGYTAVELALIVALLAIIGFVAWYVRDASLKTANTYNNATAEGSSPGPIDKKTATKPKTSTSTSSTSTKSTTSSTPSTTN